MLTFHNTTGVHFPTIVEPPEPPPQPPPGMNDVYPKVDMEEGAGCLVLFAVGVGLWTVGTVVIGLLARWMMK